MAASTTTGRRRYQSRRWDIALAPHDSEKSLIDGLAAELRVSNVCARILYRRGYRNAASTNFFFSRKMDLLHDPHLLPDIAKAVARIAEAVEKQQKVLLFGDYDVDGIAATILLARFLRLLRRQRNSQFEIDALVPERRHGYGLNAEALRNILQRKPDLLILLDNGINSQSAVAQLAKAGIDCIIVDHHQLGETLPNAVAVINPRRKDNGCQYPFEELCAAGLTFKLVWALAVHFSQNKKVSADFKAFLLDAFALAGAATLADVVPLIGENRVLTHHGLTALARTRSPGLRALIVNAQLSDPLSTTDVTFRIAPRLNAAGRCGQAAEALELLLTDDPDRVAALAALLEGYNTTRQNLENKILQEARQQALLTLKETPNCRSLVLDSADWNIGIIGIVASRIVEEFGRPTLLLCSDKKKGIAQGSGRSIKKLHLHEALKQGREQLLTFGGHAAAAGLTLLTEKIPAFRTVFEKIVAGLLQADDLMLRLHLDDQVSLDQVTHKLIAELELFEPCGMGNPRPTLAVFGVTISGAPKLTSNERHVSFFVRQEKTARRVIAYDCADHFNALCDFGQSGALDIAFRPKLNSYRGETSIELVLEAFRRSEA
ncbi:MAG: single-stranded-DNA-specific exonuclease RecJ [Planctomycetota bacterium]